MVRLKALGVCALLGCTPSTPAPTDAAGRQATSKEEAAPKTVTQASSKAKHSTFSWPTGLLSLLPPPFQRFDGSMIFRMLWPRLDNVRFRLAPNDPRVAIGHHLVVAPSTDGRHRMAAVLLSGKRPDSPTRDLRLVLAQTQTSPPGPLEMVAASAPKTMTVSSNAQFRLVHGQQDLQLFIRDGKKETVHHFVAQGPYLMAQPPQKGLNPAPKPGR